MPGPSTDKRELSRRPLDGLRVVEGCTFIAGPLAGMSLAQLGADVIRFDPIGGSPDRGRWPLAPDGTSLYWAGLNKNKRSITVDVRAPEGRELIVALITAGGADAGLFLTNAVGRGWLGYETLRQHREDLIQVHITGSRDGSPAVDYTVNARAGFPMVTGPEEWAGPVNHLLPAWDVITGNLAVSGLLAAERLRRHTGEGQLVRIALSDVALATAGHLGYLAEAQVYAEGRRRYGNFVYGTFGTDFETADGRRIMVVAVTDRQWRALVDATGTERVFDALAETLGVEFGDEGGRFVAREPIAAILRPWFKARTLVEVEDAFAGTAVLRGGYQTFRQLVEADPDCSLDNPLFAEIEQRGIGRHLVPGSPLRFGDGLGAAPGPAPELGQHTDEVLTEVLGLSSDELGRLHDRGVIAGAAPESLEGV